ncbi:hypothetical protein PR048_025750 [Dryococelus australis]|uniref:Uncharacterized protein n=1 Tax=Dryococelus australis TaxID=614101 RepID=A0ABQ9GJE2_9NEOP|nr:hypothetical protein PR048_025750 [Dryococelus australis]
MLSPGVVIDFTSACSMRSDTDQLSQPPAVISHLDVTPVWSGGDSLRTYTLTTVLSFQRTYFLSVGAAVDERLACSPPTKAIRVNSPGGSLQIFVFGNRVGRCRWSACFLGDLPFPPPFNYSAAPYFTSTTLIGSQDLDYFIKRIERGGAVVIHWTRIREDPDSIPGPAILILVFHCFPKCWVTPPGEPAVKRECSRVDSRCRLMTRAGRLSVCVSGVEVGSGRVSCLLCYPPRHVTCSLPLPFFTSSLPPSRHSHATTLPPARLSPRRAGPLPYFRKWESCRTMTLAGEFSRGSPVCPVLAFRTSSSTLHSPQPRRIFARGNRAGRCRWFGGSSRGSPVPPTPLFLLCSMLTSITFIGSQDLAFMSEKTYNMLAALPVRPGRASEGACQGQASYPRSARPFTKACRRVHSDKFIVTRALLSLAGLNVMRLQTLATCMAGALEAPSHTLLHSGPITDVPRYSGRTLAHTEFDTSWRSLVQSSPSTVSADNQYTACIGKFVHKTEESSLQVSTNQLGRIYNPSRPSVNHVINSQPEVAINSNSPSVKTMAISTGMKGWWKRKIPEKTHRPVASSGSIRGRPRRESNPARLAGRRDVGGALKVVQPSKLGCQLGGPPWLKYYRCADPDRSPHPEYG